MRNSDKEYEEVRAILKSIAQSQKEAAKAAEAARKKFATEFRRRLAASEAEREKSAEKAEAARQKFAAEFHRRLAASEADREKSAAEFDRRLQATNEQIGGFTENYARALEDEFFFALEEEKRIGDIVLHDVQSRVRYKNEYDLVGVNGDCVVVGEIKHKLLKEDVVRFVEKQLPHFAEDFPMVAKGRRLLGMVGGGAITPGARNEAKKRGLIVLRLKNKKLIVENAPRVR